MMMIMMKFNAMCKVIGLNKLTFTFMLTFQFLSLKQRQR